MMPSAFEQFSAQNYKAKGLPGDFFVKKLVIEQRCEACGAYRILTESNG